MFLDKFVLDGNITMKVGGVFLHPNQKVPVVFLVNEKEDEVITLMVGFLEARAIMVSYKQIETPRPLTIDLTLALLDEKYGLKFEKIVIHSITDGAFIADIYIKKNGELIKQDARPSDGIALALRARVPIEVGARLINSRGGSEKENAKALFEYLKSEADGTDELLFEQK